MLKTNAFLALFFKGSDLVLEEVFGSENAWKTQKRTISENLKNSDFPMGKLRFSRFRRFFISIKIVKKLAKFACFGGHRFWEKLGRVWGWFWEVKILDFHIFSMFFQCRFWRPFQKSQKSAQDTQQDAECANLVVDSGCPQPPGERKREGNKSLGLHKELGLSDSPFVIWSGRIWKRCGYCPARFAHLRWAADCNPPGGTTAAPPFCSWPLW